jgi:hypothetical protein
MILLEVGSGVVVKPDFFEKLTIAEFHSEGNEDKVEITEYRSGRFSDTNVV